MMEYILRGIGNIGMDQAARGSNPLFRFAKTGLFVFFPTEEDGTHLNKTQGSFSP